jgi:proteasome lid subunit RPN8/RPN11
MTAAPDVLRLSGGIAEAMIAHARRSAPRECCGLLVGRARRVEECVPTRNIDPDPARYLVDPAEHIRLNRRLRGTGRSVMGVYHSHPRSPAEPSPTDIAEALYPEFVYVIVSLASSGTEAIQAFRIVDGNVGRLDVDLDMIGLQT